MIRSIGLIVNPVAGIGGPAGLKGSDGPEVQESARHRGSCERASVRALAALSRVAEAHPEARVVTAASPMGAEVVAQSGLVPHVVYEAGEPTTAEDTKVAARAIVAAGADLLVFVGGDGTARDVAEAVGPAQPVLGIPAGVKMYSACFAISPVAAGELMTSWVSGDQFPVQEREVLDVDEEQLRDGRVDARLYGLVSVPFSLGRTQARKSGTAVSELAAVESAAKGVIAEIDSDTYYLLGPGGTTAAVARELDIIPTHLGVDIVKAGELVQADATESQILDLISGHPTKAVVTVIGGQGFVLGRGNQQISARVLATIGPQPLLVVAAEDKLIALGGRPLLVDTDDEELDRMLAGYLRVITGINTASVYPVHAA